MKNILIIIGSLKIGGAERIVRDIGFYADKTKYRIHYLVFDAEDLGYAEELKENGCLVHWISPPYKRYRAFCRELYALMKENSIDVVHSHTMFSSVWPVACASKLGIKKRIVHSHTIRGTQNRSIRKAVYEVIARHLICMLATDYVACGQGAGDWLFGKRFFQKHGQIIYNAINLKDYLYNSQIREEIRAAHNLKDRLVIGHVGHMLAVKNQTFLLDLTNEIIKERPESVLLLLGDGPDRQMLEDKVRQLHLDDHVIMCGNVSNVGDFLNAMDVFAFPSLYEGMPLSVIEAQTNGLPCILSDRVPEDVYLTDLVKGLSIENTEEWVSTVLSSGRSCSEEYGRKMKEYGFDLPDMLDKIYRLYEA